MAGSWCSAPDTSGRPPPSRRWRAGEAVALADDWSATERWQVNGAGGGRARPSTPSTSATGRPSTRCSPTCGPTASCSSPPRPAGRSPTASRTARRRSTSSASRRVAEAIGALDPSPGVVFGSSLHVYGPGLEGEIGPEQPYGPQGDLAHLSKVYGELSLRMHAQRHGFDARDRAAGDRLRALARASTPGRTRSTVVDKFRRMAATGEPLTLDGGGRATIGVVHVADAARILLDPVPRAPRTSWPRRSRWPTSPRSPRAARPPGTPGGRSPRPTRYAHRVAEYL